MTLTGTAGEATATAGRAVANPSLQGATSTRMTLAGAPALAVATRVSGAGDYLCQARLNWFRGISYPATVANVYMALFSAAPDGTNAGGTELSGKNYSRVAIPCDSDHFSNPAPFNPPYLGIANRQAITFPTPSGDWLPVGWFGFFDASTGGNLLAFGSFNVFISAYNVAPVALPVASIIIQSLRADYLARACLQWYQGVSYPSAPSVIYKALYTTVPDTLGTGGVELSASGYDRAVVAANTSQWTTPAQPGGAGTPWQIKNVGTIGWLARDGWSGIVAHGFLDAASGGNVLTAGANTGDTSAVPGVTVLFPVGGDVISDR